MSYAIIGESIKSAISLKLGDIFGANTYRYKESVTNMKYPNFFINQLQITPTPKGKNRLELDYFMNIRYRYVQDISTVTGLQQNLDEIGLTLCSQLTELDLEKPTKTYNRYYEKDTDGVLQFYFNIKVYVNPETTEEDKLEKYKLNKEVL